MPSNASLRFVLLPFTKQQFPPFRWSVGKTPRTLRVSKPQVVTTNNLNPKQIAFLNLGIVLQISRATEAANTSSSGDFPICRIVISSIF